MVQRGTREAVERQGSGDFDQLRSAELEIRSRAVPTRNCKGVILRHWTRRLHLLDRPDTRNRLLGVGKSERHRANKPPIDIHGAAAHPLNHAGLVEGPAREPGQDDRLLGSDVFQHAQHLYLEFLNPIAREYSFAYAALSHPDVFQGENGGLSAKGRCYNRR